MIIVLIFLFIRNDRSVIPVHIQVCDIRISFLILILVYHIVINIRIDDFGRIIYHSVGITQPAVPCLGIIHKLKYRFSVYRLIVSGNLCPVIIPAIDVSNLSIDILKSPESGFPAAAFLIFPLFQLIQNIICRTVSCNDK